MEQTKKLLTEHFRKYPRMQIQDALKFIFQSAKGCEHMVSSADAVTEYIEKEFADISHGRAEPVERLDGDFSRVSLAYLEGGLAASTLGRLFCASSMVLGLSWSSN